MSKEQEVDEKALHKKFAVSCFNGTWDLLDKPDRAAEEADLMIHTAHASRYHWSQIGEPIQFARGDWQIARVYAVLGYGDMAVKYGKSCLQLCQANDIGDFDLAFAHEAIARGYAIIGDSGMKIKHIKLAQAASEAIAKKEDKEYFLSELNTIS